MAKNLESKTRHELFDPFEWIPCLFGLGTWYVNAMTKNNRGLYVEGVSPINLMHRLYQFGTAFAVVEYLSGKFN